MTETDGIKTMKETSKLFNKMGNKMGIKEVRKSHRGIIAKRVMPRVEAWELAMFEEQLVDMTPRPSIRVRDMKGNITWI